MSTDTILEYKGQAFINFRDFDFEGQGKHRFRWVDTKKFTFSLEEWDDRLVLAALIANAEFPDDYVGGGVDREGLRHGPYWRSSITPEVYQKIDTAFALDVLDRWLSGCGMIPAALNSAIVREVRDPMRAASSCYILPELDSSASNDYGDIHIEFHEFVLINAAEKSVLLVVATDD